MKKIFLLIFVLSGCANVQSINGNHVKWERVLQSQPIEAGEGNPIFQDIIDAHKNCDKMKFTSDAKAFNRSDYWATPKEFIQNGKGDCEDFAICKYYALRSAGFKYSDLKIIFGTNRLNRYHVILSVNFLGKKYILDNMYKEIIPYNQYMKYFSPIYSLNEKSMKVY